MKNNESELFWSHAAAIHHGAKEPCLGQSDNSPRGHDQAEETAVTVLTSIELTGFLKLLQAVAVLGQQLLRQ